MSLNINLVQIDYRRPNFEKLGLAHKITFLDALFVLRMRIKGGALNICW